MRVVSVSVSTPETRGGCAPVARRGSSWLGPLGPRRVLRWLPALPVLAVAVRLMAGPNLDFVRGPRLALLQWKQTA